MLRNYIISALRNISRQKLFSFINIAGLAAGLTVAIFIFLWVSHELSYDRFHRQVPDIYRVEEDQFYKNGTFHVTVTPWPSGPVWQNEIPEIALTTRFAIAGNILVSYGEKRFYESGVYGVDSAFFQIFSFPLKQGDPSQVLRQPHSIVISDAMAAKYFGDENPVGKTLRINNKDLFEVTGVFQKVPSNSSLEFDMLVSFDYMQKHQFYSESWGNNSIQTFVMLKPGTAPGPVNDKLTEVVNEHKEGNTIKFMLFPLEKIHLYMYFGFDQKGKGIQSVYLFSLVGLFLLIIAAVNFTNLTTAKSSTRAREIGMRKVMGAHRKNLILQFLGESLILSFIAVAAAIVIILLAMPAFNTISGKSFTGHDLLTPDIIAGILLITAVTGLLAGIYPALILSGMKPLHILRSKGGDRSGKGWFRKITVIIQFSLTIILITGSIVIYRQLRLLQTQRLGYDKENLLYLPLRGEEKNSYHVLKGEMEKSPVVESVTGTLHLPYLIGSNSGGASWPGKDPASEVLISTGYVDFGYTQTMKIAMKEGRTFSPEYGTDAAKDTTASFLVNEEMEKVMGMDTVLGTVLHFMGFTGPIIGVMKNYNFHSARQSIQPLAVVAVPPEYLNYPRRPAETRGCHPFGQEPGNSLEPHYARLSLRLSLCRPGIR